MARSQVGPIGAYETNAGRGATGDHNAATTRRIRAADELDHTGAGRAGIASNGDPLRVTVVTSSYFSTFSLP
jgi:hypothetical protein